MYATGTKHVDVYLNILFYKCNNYYNYIFGNTKTLVFKKVFGNKINLTFKYSCHYHLFAKY